MIVGGLAFTALAYLPAKPAPSPEPAPAPTTEPALSGETA
jgi:hypothetical protein